MKTTRAMLIGGLVVLQFPAAVVAAKPALQTIPSFVRAGEPQPFQELRCRGGAELRIIVNDGRTTAIGEQTKIMVVTFTPSAQPADPSGRNLHPGQCAFPQRTVRTNEPIQIVQEIVYFAQLNRQRHGDPVDTSPNAAEKYPDAQNVPKYLGDAKHYWIFFVRQTGPLPSGLFEVSNGHAWKPGKENEILIPNSDRNKDRVRVSKPNS